jgi:hypothetical protein
MAHGLKTIKVAPGSELAKLLEEARGGDLLLEKDGHVYRLNREEKEDIWAGYDPEKVREALRKSAGALAGVDTHSLLAEIHAARKQASHGRPA